MSPTEDLAAAATRWHSLPPGWEKDQAKATVISKTAELVRAGGKGLALDVLRKVIPSWMAAGIVGLAAGALRVFGPKVIPPDILRLIGGGSFITDPDESAPWISKSVEHRLMQATKRVKGRSGAGLVEIVGPQGAGKTASAFRIAEVLGKPIAVLEYPAALLAEANAQRSTLAGVDALPIRNCKWSGSALNALHNCSLVVPDTSMFLDAYDYGGRMQRAFGNLIIFAAQRDVTVITDMHATSLVLRRTHALVRATYYRGMVNVEHGEIGERDELIDVSRKARTALLTVPASCQHAMCAVVGRHQCRRAVTYARFTDELQGLMRIQLPQTFKYDSKFSKARESQSLFGFGRQAKDAEAEDAVDAEFTAEGE